METTHTMVKMVLDRWFSLTGIGDATLAALTDAQLGQEIAPGKNRGIYVLGHLIAVHDDMLPLLGFGEKAYPELSFPFIQSPDKTTDTLPSVQELRTYWHEQNRLLTEKLESLQPEEWFEKHSAVSAEDFAREPHRNKLNIIVTRTSHLSYHLGQLNLLKTA